MSASLTSDGRHRLHIQRECYRAYLDEEMSLQQKRREMHKSRPFKEGAFLGLARVLFARTGAERK